MGEQAFNEILDNMSYLGGELILFLHIINYSITYILLLDNVILEAI